MSRKSRIWCVAFAVLLPVVLATLSCSFYSDGPVILPEIYFMSGADYVSYDTIVNAGDTVTIGVRTRQAQLYDKLTTLKRSVSYDENAERMVEVIDVPYAYTDRFNYDFIFQVRQVAGTEKYTITITNNEGRSNAVSVTLTVR